MSAVLHRVAPVGLGVMAGVVVSVLVAVRQRSQTLICLTPVPGPPGAGPCGHSPIHWSVVILRGVATAAAIYLLVRLLVWGMRSR